MKLIVCLSNGNGMLFNHRRQSQDKVLREKILEMTKGRKLWMNAYSAGQFANENETISISEQPFKEAEPDDFVFVEDLPVESYKNQIDEVIVFKWNRDYPADFFLDLDLQSLKLCQSDDFPGNSHKKITMELYKTVTNKICHH